MSETDIVVVGGGIAGLTAANRAAQLGLKALVLEKGTEDKYLCNTRYTGGTLHVCMSDIMSGEDALLEKIETVCADIARPDLARAIAQDAERAVRWLQGEGCKFLKASASPHHRWVLAPPGRTRPGLDWEGRAGDVLLRRLGGNLEERGGKLQRGARATKLLLEDGRCVGVVAEVDGKEIEYRASAVVIADGGFQSSPEHLAKYITPNPSKLFQRNAESGTGDGLRLASAAGADLRGMDRFYGHLLSIDAPHRERLWPYPYLDALVVAGILIGPDGKRFCDEGMGGVYATNCVAQLSDPLSSIVIFDHEIWEKAGKQGLISANPHLPNEGGTLHITDTLEELSEKIGLSNTVISNRVLSQTVDDYNAALKNESFGALLPSRSTAKGSPQPIRTPPFYAAPARAGITYTMGGIAIDGDARALRPDDTVIEGLYAAGASTGGLEGGAKVGYVGGLSKSAITGLRAAEHAAARK
jgi:fumarate reductase flavoprotein subunit